MYYFYVLYSLKDHKLYKGYSADLGKRFVRHNLGGNTSTKHRTPLILIYAEAYKSKKDALARERLSKTLEGSQKIIQLLIQKKILNKDLLLLSRSAG